MAEWYYVIEGKEHGPVSTEQLKEMARDGRLKPDDLLWREGMKEWLPAAGAKGLFHSTTLPISRAAPNDSASTPSEDRAASPHATGDNLAALARAVQGKRSDGANVSSSIANAQIPHKRGGRTPNALATWFACGGLGVVLVVIAIFLLHRPNKMLERPRHVEIARDASQNSAYVSRVTTGNAGNGSRSPSSRPDGTESSDRGVVVAERAETHSRKEPAQSLGDLKRQDVLLATSRKLTVYYVGPLNSVVRQLEELGKAGQASQYQRDVEWHRGYSQAYIELLSREQQRVKEMPFFADEEKQVLGKMWDDIRAADNALLIRIQCAIKLHKRSIEILSNGVHGAWSGKEGDVGGIVSRLQKTADRYCLEAAMQHKYMKNLLDQRLMEQWSVRLEKEGLTLDAVRVSAGAETALAESAKALEGTAEAIKRDQDKPVIVLCPKCAGTGRKSDKEINDESSALNAATIGSGRSGTMRIDPTCPECKGKKTFTISRAEDERELQLLERRVADNACRALVNTGVIKSATFISYVSGLKYSRTPPGGVKQLVVRYVFTFTTKAGFERTNDWGYIVIQEGNDGWEPIIANVDGMTDMPLR